MDHFQKLNKVYQKNNFKEMEPQVPKIKNNSNWRAPTRPSEHHLESRSLNISDLLENDTIDAGSVIDTPLKSSSILAPPHLKSHQFDPYEHNDFQPSEMTGRSTEFSQFSQFSGNSESYRRGGGGCGRAITVGGISGASSTVNANTRTVEEILAESMSDEIRELASKLGNVKFGQNRDSQRSSIASSIGKSAYCGGGGGSSGDDNAGPRRTADMSLMSSFISTASSSGVRNDPIDFGYRQSLSAMAAQIDAANESFNSNDNEDIINKGEIEWKMEYADIPPTVLSSSLSITEPQKKTTKTTASSSSSSPSANVNLNLSDFSSYNFYQPDVNYSSIKKDERDFSIGKFFRERCDPLHDMIPNDSPHKKQKPHSIRKDDGNNNKEHLQLNSILNKNQKSPVKKLNFKSQPINGMSAENSIMSVSKITEHFENDDTPQTLVRKLLKENNDESYVFKNKSSIVEQKKKPPPPQETSRINDETITESIDLNEPLADILYITKKLPLSPINTKNQSKNVNILQYEEIIANSDKILKSDQSNHQLAYRPLMQNTYSVLTPNRQHITTKKNQQPQQNNKENVDILADTVIGATESLFERSPKQLKSPKTQKVAGATAASNHQHPNRLCSITETENQLRIQQNLIESDNDADNEDYSEINYANRRKRTRQSPHHSPKHATDVFLEDEQPLPATTTIDSILFQEESSFKFQSGIPDSPRIDDNKTPPPYAGTPLKIPLSNKKQNKSMSPRMLIESTEQLSDEQATTTSSAVSSPRYCSSKHDYGYLKPTSARQLLNPLNQCVGTGGGGGGGGGFSADGDYGDGDYHKRNRTRSRSMSPTLLNQCDSNCAGSTIDLYNKNDIILALKASCNQLNWTNVRLRKSSTKSFTIKNMSHRKMSIKMEINGPGYQISTTGGVTTNELSSCLILQAHECRNIPIIFCPTMIGPAIGKITFHSSSRQQQPMDDPYSSTCNGFGTTNFSVAINLYGYGGNTTMQIKDINRGPMGPAFLNFGDIREIAHLQSIERKFLIYNRGPLRGMFMVKINGGKKVGDRMLQPTNIIIHPKKCIINADGYQQVSVVFHPRRSELKKLFKKPTPSVTIATLEVFYGNDSNRQRLRQLIEQKNQYKSLMDIVDGYPDEIYENFDEFVETEEKVAELFATIRTEEIALTLNYLTLNETTDSESDMANEMDETLMFRTLMPEPMPPQPITTTTMVSSTGNLRTEQYQNQLKKSPSRQQATSSSTTTNHQRQVQQQQYYNQGKQATINKQPPSPPPRSFWQVSPSFLLMNPFGSTNIQKINIQSNFSTQQTFEIQVNFGHILEIRPQCGVINPGDNIQIQIKILKVVAPSEDILLTIFIENDKRDVIIRIDKHGLPSR